MILVWKNWIAHVSILCFMLAVAAPVFALPRPLQMAAAAMATLEAALPGSPGNQDEFVAMGGVRLMYYILHEDEQEEVRVWRRLHVVFYGIRRACM